MEFLVDYGSFLLKTVSFIIIISIPFFILFSSKGKDASPSGTLKITNLSDKLDSMAGAVKSLTLNKNERKKLQKEKKKNLKAKKNKPISKPVFVLNFNGDIEASSVENLKEEITAILKSETKCQELVFYRFACYFAIRVSGENIELNEISLKFGHTMLPIAFAYHVTHYLGLLLFESQTEIGRASCRERV